MNDKQAAEFERTKECNFAISPAGIGRFRVNAFMQQGNVGLVLRTIPQTLPTIDALNLPKVLKEIALTKRGLVIFVGATGSGKSTSLAAMVDHRNENTFGHIITVEDPIEFVHPHKNCIVTQREVGIDTDGWEQALKNTLRQAPDVILMGEIRDRETMEHAVAFAETGHLCMATLHANSANQALDRIINFFPDERRAQLLMDLSLNLKALVSQRLLPRQEGRGRVAAVEIMLNTPLISDLIFKGEVGEIKELMKRSRELGMQTFDQSLFDLYESQLGDLRRRAAQRRFGERPAAADQAPQPARAQPRPGRRHRAHEGDVAQRGAVHGSIGAMNPRSYEPTPPRRVAFLGLGVMGYPMAGHLARAGHDVTVYNRTAAKAEAWVAEYGGRQARDTARPPRPASSSSSPASATTTTCARWCSVRAGAFAGMAPDAVFVDHTTASADVARELHAAARERGLHFIDAPVSGGQAGAVNGALTVMCGGDAAPFDAMKPLALAFAKAVTRIGDSGAGQLAKMVNQIAIAGLVQGLAEAIAFGQQAGLDMPLVLDVIGKGAAQSWQMDNRGKTMVEGKFDFGFAVDWMRKDLGLVLDEARRNGAKLPVTALVDQFYADVQALGGRRWDTSSLIRRLR